MPPPPPTWHLAALPDTEPTSVLRDVAAVDATHAWAVGSEGYNSAEQYTTGVPMILQWNGSQWSKAQLPALSWKGSLQLVAAGSATDVWAVGGPMSHGISDNVTVVLRYDGTTWREVPFPAGATPSIMSITDLSVVDGHAWLVGHRNTDAVILEWTGQTWQEHKPPAECVQLLFHRNGSAWRAVQLGVNQQKLALQAIDGRSSADTPAPMPPNTVGTTFEAIATVPGTDRIFAVGTADLKTTPLHLQAVILEYASIR